MMLELSAGRILGVSYLCANAPVFSFVLSHHCATVVICDYSLTTL